MLEAQLSEAIRTAGITDQQMMLDYNRILATVIDPQRFPELTTVVESGVMSKADHPDDEFTSGWSASSTASARWSTACPQTATLTTPPRQPHQPQKPQKRSRSAVGA